VTYILSNKDNVDAPPGPVLPTPIPFLALSCLDPPYILRNKDNGEPTACYSLMVTFPSL
jgi:hypothetical protein